MFKRFLSYYSFKLLFESHFDPTFEKAPFFIISAGRSGSTLLRKLLMENYEIHIPPESSTIIPSVIKWHSKFFFKKKETGFVDGLSKDINQGDFKFWNIEPKDIEALMREKGSIVSLNRLIYAIYDLHRERYNPSGTLIGDKTPYLVFYLKHIGTIYPNAKFIFLVRSPFSVISSRMKNFSESIEQATNRWVWSMKEMKRHLNLNHIVLKYEDLVNDVDNQIERLGSFLEAKRRSKTFFVENEVMGDINLKHHNRSKGDVEKGVNSKHVDTLSDKEVDYITRRCSKYMTFLDI